MEERLFNGGEEESAVLSFLSFTAMSANNIPTRQIPTASMQGVLWKRRDVFRNRWRPRWFVLHPRQGILTYYLLNTASQPPSESSTPMNRRRADSDISMETIDYDVVPRGSIFLGNAEAEINDLLTRPEERLYVLTITDLESNALCHLACRTSTARDRWLAKIQQAIVQLQNPPSQTGATSSESASGSRDSRDGGPTRTVNEIVFSDAEDTSIGFSSWQTLPSEDLTSGIPPIILSRIDALLEKNLPYVTNVNHSDFKVAYKTQGVEVASHKTFPIQRSVYAVARHHPADHLGLIWNVGYASELEPNMRTRECLRIINSHTALFYTAYHPIWPSAPRDFCTVAHWRLVENEKEERALVYIAFSCPEANKLKAVPSNHVRGTLNISLQCWLPSSHGGCTHISVFSVDMNGSIPKPLIQTLQQQQATLPPRAMDAHLSKILPSETERREMDYDTMVRAIATLANRKRPHLRHGQSIAVTSRPSKPSFKAMQDISIWREVMVLLLPQFVRLSFDALATGTGSSVSYLEVFAVLIAMIFCLRWVILRQLLRCFLILPTRSSRPLSRSRLVCRVSVDIAPVLDFLESERQVKIAFDEGKDLAEWQLDHVLLGAISQAIQNYPILVARSLPFSPCLYNLDMQWFQAGSTVAKTIPSQHQHSIQAIANYCAESDDSRSTSFEGFVNGLLGATCDVWIHDLSKVPSSNSVFSQDEHQTCGSLVTVVAYLGKEKGSTSLSMLDLSISFQSSDLESCESFTKDVARSVQYPELCLQSR